MAYLVFIISLLTLSRLLSMATTEAGIFGGGVEVEGICSLSA